MGLLVVHQRVCDICESNVGVCRYRIVYVEDNNRRVSIDLCEVHQAPVEDLKNHVPAGPGGRAHKRQVVTKQEVKAQRRTPAKKATPRRK